MPADPRKRQKQQERRAAKRKAKHRQMTRARHAGLPERLAAAAGQPVLHSWATEDLWDKGLGWVCLSRELPNAHVAFAVFLVDRYCLGVKNAMMDIAPRSTYESQVVRKARSEFGTRDLSPADVRKIVEASVEYARGLGLHPHPDYVRAKNIFGTIDPADSTIELEFGKDGKPFFVAGPHETAPRCRQILASLERTCGPGGYHFLIPFAGPGDILPELPGGAEGEEDDADTDEDWGPGLLEGPGPGGGP